MEGFFEKFVFKKIYYLFFRLSWIVTSCYSVKTVDEIRILGGNSRILCCVHETCDIFKVLCSVEFWILIKYNINFFSILCMYFDLQKWVQKVYNSYFKDKECTILPHINSLKNVYMHRQHCFSHIVEHVYFANASWDVKMCEKVTMFIFLKF